MVYILPKILFYTSVCIFILSCYLVQSLFLILHALQFLRFLESYQVFHIYLFLLCHG